MGGLDVGVLGPVSGLLPLWTREDSCTGREVPRQRRWE